MKKILIVEDDSMIAQIYGTKYSLAGFETMIAPDGELALELLRTFKPDLVHLDLKVPKVNGVEIIKHIRSQPELKTLPIVVLSNTYQNHLVSETMAAGATECVSKAICTPKAMLEIVNALRDRLNAHPAPGPAAEPPQAVEAPPLPAPRATAAPPASLALAGIEAEAAFHAEIRRAFAERAPHLVGALLGRVQALAGAEGDPARASELFELGRAAHSLAGNAGVAGFQQLSQMASALEALLKDLLEKPKHITASSLRTIADTGDFLARLLEFGAVAESGTLAPSVVLVVDDEVISRRAVCLAVARLNLAAISVDDPQVALSLLPENRFALIFLDVDMPCLNGFELCAELRKLPAHQSTPVVFVTSLTDFGNRDRSVHSGGNDLIAKPFLPMELAVKALTHILKNQMASAAARAE